MNPKSDIAGGRILIRGVNWLGDAVMTTPALLRLREKFPAAHITLLTPEKLAGLWREHPAINDVITFAAGESIFTISRRLRQRQFTHALVLPNSPRSALEVCLAGIPQRIGYARQWRTWLLTQPVPARSEAVKMRKRSTTEIHQLIAQTTVSSIQPQIKSETFPASTHQIHEYLHLVAALGADPTPLAPSLAAIPFEATRLSRFFPDGSERTGCFIGLNPGAEYGPAKRWPVESFAALANELYRRLDCEFLIFGGPGDVALAERLRALLPVPLAHGHVTSLAGKTRLDELMSALKTCRVLVTNDTGPMHVAAALGTPVVAPFGSTSPELTGPGLPGDPRHHLIKSDAPCAPCFLRQCPIDFRCMKGIGVDRMLAAVLQVVGR